MSSEVVKIYRDIIEDEKLELEQKKELLSEVRKIISPDENRWNFRFVIWTLALVALSVPVWAMWKSADIPQALLSLSSTAVGALAGFLSLYARRRADTSQISTLLPNQQDSSPAAPNKAMHPTRNKQAS